MPSAAGWCSLLNLRGFNLIKINGPVHKEAGHKDASSVHGTRRDEMSLRKRTKLLSRQTGFLHYEILSRIWIEGTLKIREMNELMVQEVYVAFCIAYPDETLKCTTKKIRRMYQSMRPYRSLQDDTSAPTVYEYSEPVKRHVAIFDMQQQATCFLQKTNKLLAEAALDASSPEFVEHHVGLAKLHREFESLCNEYTKDVASINDSRIALQIALEQIKEAIAPTRLIETTHDDVVEEPGSNARRLAEGLRPVVNSLYKKHLLFLKKATQLVRLHTEYMHRRQLEKNKKMSVDVNGNAKSVPCDEEAVPILNTAEAVQALELDIIKAENVLLSLYEKKHKFGKHVMRHRNSKFLGFFLLPDGKVKHFSVGLGSETGDERHCRLLLAKYGHLPRYKGKRITHYTSK